MKRIFSVVGKVLLSLLVVVCMFISYLVGSVGNKMGKAVEKDKSQGFDLEMPLEVQRRRVTVDEVEAQLFEISELSTYYGEYTFDYGKEEKRYWLEVLPILGTTNYIELKGRGIVKVGFDMNEIVVKVDDDTIYIALPEAKLHDNYIVWDSLNCTEHNSILNPINFAQYQELINEIEQKGLDDVVERGIYKSANENFKTIIEAFLADFEGYEIVYM